MSDVFIKVPNQHFRKDKRGEWQIAPGRLETRVTITRAGPAETEARKICDSASRIAREKLRRVERGIATFIQSQMDLYLYLHTPLGDIPVKADGAKVQNHWHLYLMRGRELLDALGHVLPTCFGLKDKIDGINGKKLRSLRTIISRAKGKADSSQKSELDALSMLVDSHEQILLEFIDLRNRSKQFADTILDLPWISASGAPSAGLVGIPNVFQKDFTIFFKESYLSIRHFSASVLGVK